MKKIKKNSGFSLIELLVSLAVAMIIMSAISILVTQCIKSYRTQTTTSRLQNAADISLSNITDNVMEGYEDGSFYISLTNSALGATTEFACTNEIKYVFEPELNGNGKLYLVRTIGGSEDKSELCDCVKSFSVKLADSSCDVNGNNEIVGLNKNSIEFQITLSLEDNGINRTTSRTVRVRNPITDIKAGGESIMYKKTGAVGGYLVSGGKED